MIEKIKKYEKWLNDQIKDGQIPLDALLDLHEKHIGFVQHERLVHLLVTLFAAVLVMFFLLVSNFVDSMLVYLLLILSTGLFVSYLIHYARLENSIQKWYEIYHEIWKRKIN